MSNTHIYYPMFEFYRPLKNKKKHLQTDKNICRCIDIENTELKNPVLL